MAQSFKDQRLPTAGRRNHHDSRGLWEVIFCRRSAISVKADYFPDGYFMGIDLIGLILSVDSTGLN